MYIEEEVFDRGYKPVVAFESFYSFIITRRLSSWRARALETSSEMATSLGLVRLSCTGALRVLVVNMFRCSDLLFDLTLSK